MGTEFFVHHPILGLLSNLPVLLGALALWLVCVPAFMRPLARRPGPWLTVTFIATRLLFMLFIVVALRHVSLDLSTYFQAQGDAVRQGGLPYRDFTTSYAPLFPYLMALPTALRGEVVPLFLFFIACDGVTLLLLVALARARGAAPAAAAWLYAAAPVTWYFLVRYGQDEALSAAFLAGACLLMARRREGWAAFVLALGFAATKFTFGLFVPPFFIAARHPGRFALVAGLTVLAAFAPFVLAGAPVLRPLTGESAGLGFGPSVWRLPVVFTPFVAGRGVSALLGLALLVVWAYGWRRRTALALEPQLLLGGLVFLILSPKVMPMYITPFWALAALRLAGPPTRPGELRLAVLSNLLLGVWWYLDAGGIGGQFGPIVQAVAILCTAAIPLTLAAWVVAILRDAEGQAPIGASATT